MIDVVSNYEYDLINRHSGNKAPPHHFHGIIAIPKGFIHKFCSDDLYLIDPKLQASFDSVVDVSSVLIEPLRLDAQEGWLRYIYKDMHLAR